MKYSKLFGKTIKDIPKDATLASHKLLYQAGFIRESAAGRYFHLPLGLRVMQKIKKIIKEEMDRAGAQELTSPVLHPKELWKETNRTDSVGFELMSIKDRNEAEFVLGGTAEEMMVDLVRKFQISYKDLPFNIYQFSSKFRDEMRARGGLLRLREFVMKDAYSFHATEEDFKIEYQKMKDTYSTIFDRLGLNTVIVESDNGYIGGEYCHEFVVEADAGESKFLVADNYAAHEDIAKFIRDDPETFTSDDEKTVGKGYNLDEEDKAMEEVDAVRGPTMEDGVKLHNLPLWQQMKDLMMVDEKGNFILGVIRGDLEVNEVKLAHLAKAYTLRHATVDEIRTLGSEPGFISPVGLTKQVLVIGDISLRTVKNMYTGANKKHTDLLNVNIDRDYTLNIEGDIALAKEGYLAEDGKKLQMKKGIEVGNVFQLGFHYSSKMDNAKYKDADGTMKPYYMGCYGIGLDRTLATVAEIYHDDRGLMWPTEIAPFLVHLVAITNNEESLTHKADTFYNRLISEGIEVLYDDRDVRAGEKFADADLIGLPIRLVISAKTNDQIEVKRRIEQESNLMNEDEVLHLLRELQPK